MNIYFIGMCVSMVIYIAIGIFVSSKVKDLNDFYVAGRRAPVSLIAGSMIASYTSTGLFMGDAAQCYQGAFTSVVMFAGMQSAGYIIGAVFFGRYLRRSNVLTIPEFFGKRFCSRNMQILAAVTAIIMMTVYLLSVIQGIGTLMTTVTGVSYNVCIAMALSVFTFITVIAGSRGVLITDTLMASIFTGALLATALYVSHVLGGWFDVIEKLASDPKTSLYMSWGGAPGPLYDTGIENIGWGLINGVAWMAVCMVGPWQSSRYLMAKDEHTVIRSAPISALGVFVLEFVVGIVAVMVNLANYKMENASHVMIWAAMNLLPEFLGVVLLTGVLAAGISSATTFLSLIGASFAGDIFQSKDSNAIRHGQYAMIAVSGIVFALAFFNPPSIFWVMMFGVTIAASAWLPVALGSVFSKSLTKTGAMCGMSFGFISCFVVRLYAALNKIELPVYLDPGLVGMVFNVIGMFIGTKLSTITEEEIAIREYLMIVPDTECVRGEIAKTMQWAKASIGVGVVVFVGLLILWVLPYTSGLNSKI